MTNLRPAPEARRATKCQERTASRQGCALVAGHTCDHLHYYAARIAKATGVTDARALDYIEETMRVMYGTLDNLSARRFNNEARAILREMAQTVGVAQGIAPANATLAKQADGATIVVDRSKCFFPAKCPGCSNCDRFVFGGGTL